MAIEKTKPANLAPSTLSRFKRIVLGWDYLRLLRESNKRDKSGGGGLKRVKNSYEDLDEYFKVFEPLLFEEVKAQIAQQNDEEEESNWDNGGIAKCVESEGFHMVNLVVQDAFQEEVSENDLLILSEKEFTEGEVPGAYCFALVEHRGAKEALKLITFLDGEVKQLDKVEAESSTRLLKMLSILKESDKFIRVKKVS